MLEASRGMVVRGTAGWYNGFRCVNLHVAHGVIIEDNVCYRSSSTAYFVEQEDELGYNEDNVFVHNIAIATMPRPRSVDVAGESRVAGFWPGETFNEAFLGNVAAGGGGIRESMGFHFARLVPLNMMREPFHLHSSVTKYTMTCGMEYGRGKIMRLTEISSTHFLEKRRRGGKMGGL